MDPKFGDPIGFLYQTGINAVFLTTLARTRKSNWIRWKIDTSGKVAD
jgi:hypothetical protein